MVNPDILETSPTTLKGELGLSEGQVDLLAGGPPCQAFSVIGKRMSLDDHRGQLLFQMIDYATVLRPKAILIEQVKGLLSAKGSDGVPGSAISTILDELKSLGYSTTQKVLNAAHSSVHEST